MTGALVWLALAGCTRPGDPDVGDSDPDETETETDSGDTDGTALPEGPVYVLVTVDTLGATAARAVGWCARLDAVLAEYGLDGACVDGAVAPGSWTGPSHTRLFFPTYRLPPNGWRDLPGCGEQPFPATLAAHLGGPWVFGADNRTLGSARNATCGEDSAFWQGAAQAFDENVGSYTRDEQDTAVHKAVLAFLEALDTGGPGVLFLNIFEAGGHAPPRCAFDPTSDACEALWTVLVEHGTPADLDREDFWYGNGGATLDHVIDEHYADDPSSLRPAIWQSILDTVEHFHGPKVDDRLRLLLDGLEARGRLDDLVLVVTADHGENPAVIITPGEVNSMHQGVPTEWTANVPAYVAPAARARAWSDAGYLGDADRFWSTGNLAYAFLADAGAAIPEGWPPMEPVGTATTWECWDNTDPTLLAGGVHIEGDVAVRCRNDDCVGLSWRVPVGYDDGSEVLGEVPASLTGWDPPGAPTGFETICE